MQDLEELTVGDVYDILTESANDDYDWAEIATLDDIKNF